MTNQILQYALYIVILVGLAIPLGRYMYKVMVGEKTFLSRVLQPVESGVCRICRIDPGEQMTWKKYALAVGLFSAFGFLFLFLLNLLQGFLPLNPEGIPGCSWHLSFNTTASFVTNTNWQAYSGEMQLSYLPNAGPHGAELRVGGQRHRGAVRTDPGLCKGQTKRPWEFLV